MFMRSMFLLFVMVSCAVGYCPHFTGAVYDAQTAEDKSTLVNFDLVRDTNSRDLTGVIPDQLTEVASRFFSQNMSDSFDIATDDAPKMRLLDVLGGTVLDEPRLKAIHPIGVVAKMSYKSKSNKYSGLFKSGAENCFGRISSASPPSLNGFLGAGMVIKCLRDGAQSGNQFFMYDIFKGQPDEWNFFEHDLTNHPPQNDPTLLSEGAQFLSNAFRAVSAFGNGVGNSEWAKIDEDGEEVAVDKVNFPYRLIIHPTVCKDNNFSNSPPANVDTGFLDDAMSIEAPSKIYDLYAEEFPDVNNLNTTEHLEKIGEFYITEKFTTSNFGDILLFYQHTRLEDDFALRTEWAPIARQIDDVQISRDTLLASDTFPDIPSECEDSSSSLTAAGVTVLMSLLLTIMI